MTYIRRLAIVVSFVLCGLLAFTATVVAFDMRSIAGANIGAKGGGGGGFFLPAGNYHNTTVNADFSVCCDSPQLTVNVNDFTSAANPLVGPTTLTNEVDVFFQACDFLSGVCGAGCFIPDGPADFTFSSNLSSAILKTTVTSTTKSCQGNPLTGFTTPFDVNVNWSGGAASGGSMGVGRYACGGYTSETMTTTAGGVNTTATATTTLISGTFGPGAANLFSFDQRIHAQGTVLDSCPPLGGKGAGPGPLAAGDYRFVSQSASASVTPNDPTQAPINLFVTSFTNVSHPRGAPATTQTETDLNIFQFSFPFFVEACFVIPSTAFTIGSGLASASLHAAIDPTTPQCQGSSSSGLPSSFTVDVSWSSFGPLATFRNTGTFSCSNFKSQASSVLTTINANASGSISGIADSFVTNQASLGTNENNFHIEGSGTC